MSHLSLDLEVFSEENLRESGVYRYAEHPSTEVILFGYCLGTHGHNDVVHLWIPVNDVPALVLDIIQQRHPTAILETGTAVPGLLDHAWHTMDKRAHNAQFERVVLNGVAGRKLGLRPTQREEWTCTAVKATEMGLPRALSDAAKALGTHAKSDAGRPEMLQITKPRRPTKADPSTRWTMQNAPEKWAAAGGYNIDDVLAECAIDEALPDISERERQLYLLDQKINDTGWYCDLEAVSNILHVVEEYKEGLAAECRRITRHKVWVPAKDWLEPPTEVWVELEPTQREKISDWIRAQGYTTLPDMQAETVQWVIKQPGVPENVKTVLRIYSTYNAKSVSKLQAMLRAVCADSRLRGMFIFYGAATGRWSSVIVQLQNMMRPLIKDPNEAIAAFAERTLDLIQFLWPKTDPMKVAGSCIRGCLSASGGKELIFPDYSGIEDRVNLWFFDEHQMLQVYRDYDAGKGRHPYSVTVCNAFGLDLKTFNDEDPRRQWGKVMRLALGYEGGVEAFVTMVETYGIDLEEMAAIVNPLLPEDAVDHAKWMREHHPSKQPEHIERACNGLKFLYRRDQPGIRQGWKDLKQAAEMAVEHQGETFWLPNRKIGFRVQEYKGRKWLYMQLPSGRSIKYYAPEWHPPVVKERWINNQLTEYTVPGYMDYMGTDTYTRQWVRQQTYGGKLDENADQGFSRDILCNAMLAIDAAGYTIVGSEHDKVIVEISTSSPPTVVQHIKQLMLQQPAYTAGLPLATDGKRLRRYGK